ncbi:hypothetical protein SAMN05444008_1172 [Cnuella takakiae]|uniref:Short chain amide porin n=1 Tax=Cnuella takakiae TaxID=1302690 RepID=A0A1M5GPJ3_9BACT|nr:hypothetical protein [Cnuella takakiae]OLY90939.1 hypothetical protein BUE76_02770 [Cnuella takakiae]SHG05558.1 hypothetical protein SAMN05444008_1172 [Cnuella takakiae]
MNFFKKPFTLAAAALMLTTAASAQMNKDRRILLNDDGSQYLKFTMASQLWARNTQLNPGSTINGYAKDRYSDIGIRRMRMQIFGQIADRVFIYTQVGENNFNFLSDRKQGFFIHDAIGEYEVVRKKLSLGAGLTGWSGLARFASPSIGTLLGVDAPLFEQSTNDVTDQFLRKLSIYAKGKLGKIDYRLTMAHPMAIQKTNGYTNAISANATVSARPAKMQANGYFQYQVFDPEANTVPYTTGTYLGSKKVLNFGAGFVYQPDAMWHMGKLPTDTVATAMRQFAADVFYDAPINKAKGTAISAYATFVHFDFGPNYLRNQSPMNMANGSLQPALINGAGNGFPAYGTGNVVYTQVGYKFRDNMIGKTTLMPYASLQHAAYERLSKDMNYVDAGVNWLLKGHTSKLTVAYQNRPLYYTNALTGKGDLSGRRGGVVVQYQVFLN